MTKVVCFLTIIDMTDMSTILKLQSTINIVMYQCLILLQLQDKSIGSLVKFYYSWKKTRSRTSLIDRQARKPTVPREQRCALILS